MPPARDAAMLLFTDEYCLRFVAELPHDIADAMLRLPCHSIALRAARRHYAAATSSLPRYGFGHAPC